MRASAPGKLVLTGEYAVLAGAPALCMAVNQRARVSLSPAPEYRVSAPGLLREPVEFAPDGNGGLHWPDAPRGVRKRLALFEAIAEPLLHAHAHAPFSAELDTSAFFLNDTKLGLGSSAALATSLTAALRRHLDLPQLSPAQFLRALMARHQSVQQGRGSGIDLATSLHGGVIEYTLGQDGAAVRAVTLPPDVHWLCVWTGVPAATGDFLARLARWRDAEPTLADSLLTSLADRARTAAAAVTDGSAFLLAVKGFGSALDELGQAAGIDVVSAPHRQVGGIAAGHGAVYKPSGAGGGDVGLAFAHEPAQLEALRQTLTAAGFYCPDVRPCQEGLMLYG